MRRIIATADKPAGKYCLKATARLHTPAGRLVASVTAYDKSPEVTATVRRACEAMRQQVPVAEVQCSAVELVMYDTCPTECDGKVSTVMH